MRKIVFAVLLIPVVFVVTSCNKETLPNKPGSWTYNYNTVTAFSAAGSTVSNTLIASNDFPPSPDSLFFYFNTYPTSSGSYAITNSTHPAAGQVGIVLSLAHTLYVPLASVSAGATVTVSGGRVSIVTPVFNMAKESNMQDSASFIATINQTQ